MANEVIIEDMENAADINHVIDCKTNREYIIKNSRKILSTPQNKIEDTHFRLGSKIHITDFYYAKPYFQDSKNAYDYAQIITEDIRNSSDFKKILENNGKIYLSIVGYGLYSELLVSYVKKELLLVNSKLKINTNTVSDTEVCKFNKPDSEIFRNVIIIVPIATTFSTSIKVEREIKRKYQEQKKEGQEQINIMQPYYNILAVVDSSFSDCTEEELPEIFKTYGWTGIYKKNKIITTKGLDNKKAVEQRYYFDLTTSWHNIDECGRCFPDKNPDCKNNHDNCLKCKNNCAKNEALLFYTDNTSLTPELIIGLPKTREIKEENNNFNLKLKDNTIRYGHIKRNQNHYHYYFNDYAVWDDNRKKVNIWLEQFLKGIDIEKQNIILSPGHFSNAEFVELVNSVVFKNEAKIIHYDPKIENPQIFDYYYNISDFDDNAQIFFVDDAVTSGTALCKVSTLLKRIKSNIQFVKCFFLVNRSGYYEDIDIKNVCAEVYAFADLHLPYIKSLYNICPLCYEKEKYEKLIENSYLTRVKLYFLEKQDKLNILEINDSKIPNDSKKKTNIPLRVEANHRIYELFNDKNKEDTGTRFEALYGGTFNEWFNQYLLEKTKSPFNRSYLNLKKNLSVKDGCILSESQIAVLKNLTQTPFYNYQIIREKTFKWVIELLEWKIAQLTDKTQNITTESFKELKLLIRRVTLLNSNYIVSYKLLYLIQELYQNYTKDDELRNFSKFFAAQVNELLHKDEARSIELNVRLQYLEKKTVVHCYSNN